MSMNKRLLEARRRFRAQKGRLSGAFNNEPFPPGIYTCRVKMSEVRDIERKGEEHPCHFLMLTVEVGDIKGRNMFPFAPALDDQDGILQCARNIRSILGDVISGRKLPGGEYEVDYDRFLMEVEDLANKCMGELVEVTVRNAKTKRDDGTPWQNVFINRGLGEDAASLDEEGTTEEPVDKGDDLDYRIKKPLKSDKKIKRIVKRKK